ncbi:MAG: GNAT family N-acetyltransferase, partial [Clostridiales bacterium]|nr:GNAT family N-acetyltransferase [Clostridiales bacterium]
GYATEACQAIVDYAFTILLAHRIIAMCNCKNTASWKLLERMYFRREGHLIKKMYFKKDSSGYPIWNDTFIYALLKDDYSIHDQKNKKKNII